MINAILIATAVLSSFFSSNAFAAENDYPIGARTMEEAIEFSGIAKFHTERNSAVQDQVSKSAMNDEKELGEYYGGTWISYEGIDAFHNIGTTDLSKISQRISSLKNTKIILVKYTQKTLSSAQMKIAIESFKDKSMLINSSDLDIANNRITVYGNKENLSQIPAILSNRGFDLGMIVIKEGGRAEAAIGQPK